MKPLWRLLIVIAVALIGAASGLHAAEIVIYGFEGTVDKWVIPDWAKTSADYVGKEVAVSKDHASDGVSALELRAEFPGGRWTGAYVERTVETTDWSPFNQLAADIYLPADAPAGLRARIILTVGEQWQWTEQNRSVELTPGQWTPLAVHLQAGSMDWKFFPDDAFRRTVRKIGIRIESDKTPVYTGPVYIDHVRLTD